MKEFLYEMKCSYVAYNTREHRQVYRAPFPRFPVALMSVQAYVDLTGKVLELTITDLDELTRSSGL